MFAKTDLEANAVPLAPKDPGPPDKVNGLTPHDVAMIVHELRSPLMAIMGYCRLLSDEPSSVPNSTLAQRIDQTGTHMLALINDLLELSSTGAGKLEIRSCRVNALRLMTDSLAVVEQMALAKGLKLKLDLDFGFPLEFLSDPQRLRQVLINLLSNAVKFTASGSVTLRARVDLATLSLCFSVIDEGPGLSEEATRRLFHPYSRLADHANTTGGTGLGLVISRNIAVAMGGSLDVASTKGKGSTFTLTLPFCARKSEPRPQSAIPPGDLETIAGKVADNTDALPSVPAQRCLVIDDSDLVRDLIVNVLLRVGHSADAAVSGADGLALAAERDYDLVLIDHHMSGMDGFETARKLRALYAGRRQPKLVGLSALVTPDDEVVARDAGLDALFAKTQRPKDLIRTIMSLLA